LDNGWCFEPYGVNAEAVQEARGSSADIVLLPSRNRLPLQGAFFWIGETWQTQSFREKVSGDLAIRYLDWWGFRARAGAQGPSLHVLVGCGSTNEKGEQDESEPLQGHDHRKVLLAELGQPAAGRAGSHKHLLKKDCAGFCEQVALANGSSSVFLLSKKYAEVSMFARRYKPASYV
jgi:hypothetical protein